MEAVGIPKKLITCDEMNTTFIQGELVGIYRDLIKGDIQVAKELLSLHYIESLQGHPELQVYPDLKQYDFTQGTAIIRYILAEIYLDENSPTTFDKEKAAQCLARAVYEPLPGYSNYHRLVDELRDGAQKQLKELCLEGYGLVRIERYNSRYLIGCLKRLISSWIASDDLGNKGLLHFLKSQTSIVKHPDGNWVDEIHSDWELDGCLENLQEAAKAGYAQAFYVLGCLYHAYVEGSGHNDYKEIYPTSILRDTCKGMTQIELCVSAAMNWHNAAQGGHVEAETKLHKFLEKVYGDAAKGNEEAEELREALKKNGITQKRGDGIEPGLSLDELLYAYDKSGLSQFISQFPNQQKSPPAVKPESVENNGGVLETLRRTWC